MKVCDYCLRAIRSRGEIVAAFPVSVDENDANASRCDFCGACGYDTLYIIPGVNE